jgi:hypothetical protein
MFNGGVFVGNAATTALMTSENKPSAKKHPAKIMHRFPHKQARIDLVDI